MSPVGGFLVGLAATVVVVLVALAYLRNSLQEVLTDLCGTVARARFWTAFSNITLFLVPLALALDHQPVPGTSQSAVFQISSQVEFAIVGLVPSVVVLGIVLSLFIPGHRQQPRTVEPQNSARNPQG